MKTINNTIVNSIMKTMKYICLVLLVIGISVSAFGTTWERVTQISDLSSGDVVIVTHNVANGGTAKVMTTSFSSGKYGYVEKTISSNKITTSNSDGVMELTIKFNSNQTYCAFWTGSGWLQDANDGNKMSVYTELTYDGLTSITGGGNRYWCWSCEIPTSSNSNKAWNLKNAQNTSRAFQYMTASSTNKFTSCTWNTLGNICIWKKSCNNPITNFTPTTKSETYGGSNKTFSITATRSGSGTVTWSTNNSSVATVSNGTVTVKGMGTATITYSVAADANNGYCEETRTCVVTVTGEPRTITFKANGGTGSDYTQTVYYNTQTTLKANSFTRSGYRFLGWNTNSSATTIEKADKASITTTTNITYYAIWKQQVTVTFKPNGGTPNTEYTQDMDVSTSTVLDTHSYSKTGYTFLGFNTNSAATTASHTSGNSYSFASNTNLFAIFQVKNYTVTLSPNGGSGSNQTVNPTYGSAMPTTLSGGGAIVLPTRDGYTFGGYEYNGTTYYDPEGASAHTWDVDGNVTLTAIWTTNTPNLAVASVDHITINSTTPSVTEGKSTTYAYGSTVTLNHGEPTSGYLWAGWNVYKTGEESTKVTVTNNQFSMPDFDVTVSANLYSDLKAWCMTFEVTDQAGTGDADVHLTSTNGVKVYATNASGNLIRIQGSSLSVAGTSLYIKITYLDENDNVIEKTASPFRLCNNGSSDYNMVDAGNTSRINLGAVDDYDQTFSISYEPTAYNVIDHYKLKLILQNNNTDKQSFVLDLYGRSLPEEFVIAAKYADDNKWYALPNTLEATEDASSAITPIEVEVDNNGTPTKVLNAPNTVLYRGMEKYKPSPNTQFASIRFTPNGTNQLEASSTADKYKMWLSSGDETHGAVHQNWFLKSSNLQAYEMRWDPANGSTKLVGFYNASGVIKMGFHGTGPKGHDIYFLPVEYTEIETSIMEWGTDHVVIDLRDESGAVSVKSRVGTGALSEAQILGVINKDAGVYRVSQALTSADAAKELTLYFYDAGDAVIGTASFIVPQLISDDNATTGGLSITKGAAATCDLVVLDGGVLTVSETSDAEKFTFKDLYVYGGGKMVVPSGTHIAFDHVILRGGHMSSSWQYQYSHPQIVLNGTMSNTSGEIYYDYLTNNSQFFSLALPYNVTLTDIVNPYFNNKRSWEIHAYDGKKRITDPQAGGWYDVEVGSPAPAGSGIAALSSSDHLTAGVGYTFFGAPQKVGTVRQKWSVNRFKMTLASGSAEAAKDGVTVTAHGMTAGVRDENVAPNDACWNMLGNPYLADLGGTSAFEGGEQVQGKILSYHNVKKEDANGNWTGGWEWVANETNVRYVRIPNNQGTEYEQVRFKDATLKAFHHFFIQASETGTFSFAIGMRAQNAPSRMRMNNSLPTELDVDFLLRLGGDEVGFGLTFDKDFSADVDLGEDMPEDLAGTNMKAYTLVGTERLTFNGLPYTAASQLIPVGYRAHVAGEYTFAYKADENADYIDHIWLTDNVTNDVVDLKSESYDFTTEAGVFDERFTLNIVFSSQITTDIDSAGVDGYDRPLKFIYQDKLYILRNGVWYDATGKVVKGFNK